MPNYIFRPIASLKKKKYSYDVKVEGQDSRDKNDNPIVCGDKWKVYWGL